MPLHLHSVCLYLFYCIQYLEGAAYNVLSTERNDGGRNEGAESVAKQTVSHFSATLQELLKYGSHVVPLIRTDHTGACDIKQCTYGGIGSYLLHKDFLGRNHSPDRSQTAVNGSQTVHKPLELQTATSVRSGENMIRLVQRASFSPDRSNTT